MFKKILLATDGSENSIRAAENARDMALKFGSSVTALYVGQIPIINLLSYHASMIDNPILPIEIEKQIEKNADKTLQDTELIFKDTGITFDKKFIFGTPEEVIIETAKEEGYDLIIVGKRGLTNLRKFLLGTVSDRVAHGAPCSLLIIK